MATTLAVAVGAVLAVGENPIEIYATLVQEAFGGPTRAAITIARTLPILGAATAAWLSLQGGVFNIGQEGQLVLGGFVAAVVGAALAAPRWVAVAAAIAAAAGLAALLGTLSALLESRYGTPIIISTLLTNFIVVLGVSQLVNSTFQEPGAYGGQTVRIRESAELPRLVAGSSLGHGVFIVTALTALTVLIVKTTRVGYSVRIMGSNREAAKASGIDTRRATYQVVGVAAAVAGITGAVEILGVQYRYADGALTGTSRCSPRTCRRGEAGSRSWSSCSPDLRRCASSPRL
ncbi:MAG: hypothetical protein OXG55_09870 [bacterium]|nr:hypothetical protein [bacterium]